MHALWMWLIATWHGAPVWAWLSLVAIIITQDIIARSTKLKANSYVQMIGNAANWLRSTILGRFPVFAQLLAILGLSRTPGLPLPAGQSAPGGQKGRVRVSVLAFMAAISLAVGCYCWTAPHRQEPQCVIAHQVVDCSTSSLEAGALAVLPSLVGMVSAGNIDWSVIKQQAISAGFQDGGCILAELAADFAAKKAASEFAALSADQAAAALAELKVHFGAPDVKFSVHGRLQ